jgi:hypothetical protein
MPYMDPCHSSGWDYTNAELEAARRRTYLGEPETPVQLYREPEPLSREPTPTPHNMYSQNAGSTSRQRVVQAYQPTVDVGQGLRMK